MLLSVTGPASDAIRAVFLRTQDDLLVLGCLRGFRSHARACVYLGLLAPFDAALVFFFQRGLEYASSAAAGAAGLPLPGENRGGRYGWWVGVASAVGAAGGMYVPQIWSIWLGSLSGMLPYHGGLSSDTTGVRTSTGRGDTSLSFTSERMMQVDCHRGDLSL